MRKSDLLAAGLWLLAARYSILAAGFSLPVFGLIHQALSGWLKAQGKKNYFTE
jgi:hypothetical protein